MMNRIYDFSQIQEAREKQNKLILSYIVYLICLVGVIVLVGLLVDNNLSFTIICALILFIFILFSIAFWKIKYGILKEYRVFLDNMETGKREDYVGVFEEKIGVQSDEESFDTYVFINSNKKTELLIHKQYSICFLKGKKYHIESVGKYVYQWEIID